MILGIYYFIFTLILLNSLIHVKIGTVIFINIPDILPIFDIIYIKHSLYTNYVAKLLNIKQKFTLKQILHVTKKVKMNTRITDTSKLVVLY